MQWKSAICRQGTRATHTSILISNWQLSFGDVFKQFTYFSQPVLSKMTQCLKKNWKVKKTLYGLLSQIVIVFYCELDED